VTDFVQWNAFFDGIALRTAALLREQRPPLHLVAVAGIGVIGYYSGLPIVDYLGLVDPAIAKSAADHPGDDLLVPGHQRSNADYVFARRPDFIVIAKGPIEGARYLPAYLAIWRHPDLARDYDWHEGPLEGYRRRAGAS
jgi:hypothetical protein